MSDRAPENVPGVISEEGGGKLHPVHFPGKARHLLAAVLFAVLAIPLTWPLAARLSTHLPGTAPDDNVVFLWNFWWMRHAWAHGLSGFFHTPFMFHPGGVDLVLHSHAALDAAAGATLFGWASVTTALNLTILAACALNGFSAYLLAWRTTHHTSGSILAGVVFAASPALVGHLSGRFSSYTAWPLALFACALLEALERRRFGWALLSGVMLAAIGYNDYYYFIYASAFLACVVIHRWFGVGVRLSPARVAMSLLDYGLLVVVAAAAGAAAVIAATGGLVWTLGAIRVSLTRGSNLRALAAAALLLWLWRRRRPLPRLKPAASLIPGDMRVLSATLLMTVFLMAPLLQAAWAAFQSGQYVTQTYFWRSAPAGVDAGTLVLGNPFNGLWGSLVMRLDTALGVWPFDGPFWLGIVPVVLFVTRSAWSTSAPARLWLLVTLVFAVWALGPYLTIFGFNTGLPLPNTLLRFIPVASNARIPGHATAYVCLAASVLLAMAIASSRQLQSPWRLAGLAAFVLVDFWAAPLPTFALERPAVYSQLAAMPDGAVLEIPLGIRDGFGEEGRLDTTVLYYQMIHGKPLVGGYIGRLPPEVKARFHSAPTLDALLKLSAGEIAKAPSVSGETAREFLRSSGVRYVVIDTRLATPEVRALVASMQLTSLARDKVRETYMIP